MTNSIMPSGAVLLNASAESYLAADDFTAMCHKLPSSRISGLFYLQLAFSTSYLQHHFRLISKDLKVPNLNILLASYHSSYWIEKA